MAKILTFVDASVLIYAAKRPTVETFARRSRALQVLGDPDREFVSSEFLRMEILPIPVYFRRQREISFYETFFDSVVKWVNPVSLLEPAYEAACLHGLGILDALHLVAAKLFNAEFVSAEKPTKPIYIAYENTSSIY